MISLGALMPHLYKPWKHGRPIGSMAEVRAARRRGEERRMQRDAVWLRIAGLPMLGVGILLFALDLRVLGLIAIVVGIGLMILDTGVVLILGLVLAAVGRVRGRPSTDRR